MSLIKQNILAIKKDMAVAAENAGRDPESVSLIAVSKKKPAEDIESAYEAGQRDFGENYIQEAIDKIDVISHDDITWHFIGHLQRNKAKFAVKYFDVIHTVDSVKLAKEINKQAAKIDKVQNILIQVKIGDESSKSGAAVSEIPDIMTEISALPHINIIGLMTIPPPAGTEEEAKGFFREMGNLKKVLSENNFTDNQLKCLSMGMTSDFKMAISEGSTHVRVGTAIFGVRP